MLEGNRIVGRIDVRANRVTDRLDTQAWWLEPGIQDTRTRRDRIQQELVRLARLANVSEAGELPGLSSHPEAV
jgi:uncharacterized protein YcaQ